MAVSFEGITPIFRVSNLQTSIDYYVGVLGFELDFRYGEGFASISRGRCGIFLAADDQGNLPTWAWVGVSDAEALHDQWRAKGAKIRHPPTNYKWAYEMQVEDPDGNVLRFGSDQKEDQPIGEWLDMNGVRWSPRAEGGWTRVPE